MAETGDITVPVLVAVTALPGGMFWRQSAGFFRTLDGMRVVKASANGIADIMGAYFGRAVAIETKTLTGKLRKTQERFKNAWIKAGGAYIVAGSPDEALAALECIRHERQPLRSGVPPAREAPPQATLPILGRDARRR